MLLYLFKAYLIDLHVKWCPILELELTIPFDLRQNLFIIAKK
jgi:hypothetical protein